MPCKYSTKSVSDHQRKRKAREHSSPEWMWGGRREGEGPMFKYLCTKLESEVFTSQVGTITLRSGVQNSNRWLSALFRQLGPSHPPPPYVYLHVHLTSFTWYMFPGLPRFLLFFSSLCYYCENKEKVKMEGGGKAWEWGYVRLWN